MTIIEWLCFSEWEAHEKLMRQFLWYQDNGKLHALRNPYAEY